MPANGFRPVSVREEIYSTVSEMAKEQNKSIADIVSEAIENYRDYRKDVRKKADYLIELLEKDAKSQK